MKTWQDLEEERSRIERDHGYISSTALVCSTAPTGHWPLPSPPRVMKQHNCKGCGAPLPADALGICDYCGFGKVIARR